MTGVEGEHVGDDALAKLFRGFVPERAGALAWNGNTRDQVQRDSLEVERAGFKVGHVLRRTL